MRRKDYLAEDTRGTRAALAHMVAKGEPLHDDRNDIWEEKAAIALLDVLDCRYELAIQHEGLDCHCDTCETLATFGPVIKVAYELLTGGLYNSRATHTRKLQHLETKARYRKAAEAFPDHDDEEEEADEEDPTADEPVYTNERS